MLSLTGEKKVKDKRDKRFVQNWRATSLLIIDLRNISKNLSEKLKEFFSNLIFSQQTAYV